MNLGKFVYEYKDVSVGFLFGYLAYNEATKTHQENESGFNRTLHFVSWIFLGGVAYQYITAKKIPTEDRFKFVAGIVSGLCHSHLIATQDKPK